MNDDRRSLDLLSDVLAAPPRLAPDGLLETVLDDVAATDQRGRRVRPFLPRSRSRRSSPWRLAIAAVLVCTVTSIAFIGLAPLAGLLSPSASESPAPAPTRSPFPATAMDSLEQLNAGVVYTSDLFLPRMTFQVNPRSPGVLGSDWCMPIPTTARTMRFHHPKSCADNLLVVRPASVDCGTPDAHPNADALAAAILANPRMARATDVGSLQTPDAIPAGMFAEPYHGRVLQVNARLAPFVGDEPCRLLDDAGTHALLDITGDLTMRLVLVDVHGELVVFAASAKTSGWYHLLEINHDIWFD